MSARRARQRGFTLIELLSALLVLSLLALMTFRGLGAVIDTRDQVAQETEKWQRVTAFLSRFQRDLQLSAPRPLRAGLAHIEFSRFAAAEGIDAPRRVAYRLNERRELEMRQWPGLDALPGELPARHVVLPQVERFELQVLGAGPGWLDTWPAAEGDPPLPRAVRLRLALASGEELVRVFALR
jgi:general secretion pathway protein J